MNTGWLVVVDGYGRHVLPLGDSREHAEDENCWCEPAIAAGIFVHNSADGREAFERGERRVN